MNCHRCNTNLDSPHLAAYEHVDGYARIRHKGTNALALQTRHDRYLCGPCVDLARHGLTDHPQLDLEDQ